jgi:hypothetical protein
MAAAFMVRVPPPKPLVLKPIPIPKPKGTHHTMEQNSNICQYTKAITKCNKRLASDLGSIGGNPRFQWKLYNELLFHKKDALGNHETKTYADMHGVNGWTMAQFKEQGTGVDGVTPGSSNSARAFETAHNNRIPYVGGKYEPFNGTALGMWDKPDLQLTINLIGIIRAQLEVTTAQRLEEDAQREAAERKSQVSTAESMIHDRMTAFRSKPGACEDVWLRRSAKELMHADVNGGGNGLIAKPSLQDIQQVNSSVSI